MLYTTLSGYLFDHFCYRRKIDHTFLRLQRPASLSSGQRNRTQNTKLSYSTTLISGSLSSSRGREGLKPLFQPGLRQSKKIRSTHKRKVPNEKGRSPEEPHIARFCWIFHWQPWNTKALRARSSLWASCLRCCGASSKTSKDTRGYVGA